jgi:hypothetical protein
MHKTARERLRAEIVKVMTDSFKRYAAEFPERIDDERNRDAVAWSYRGMGRILQALDGYEIRDKRAGKDEA